ncbi:Hsp33 family molecular chaperone HslO [Enterobacteriaceae bacterium LUAb1]
MSQQDYIHRYLFKKHAVRGELVNVSRTWREIISAHNYPQPVQALLGELLAATSLLTATLKFEGDITVQLQGDGPLHLAVINGNHQQQMRGVAHVKGDIAKNSSLQEMVGNGHLVITLSPRQGERYQGIVNLEGNTLAACLEDYFMRSEQLPTRLYLRTSLTQAGAAGILLQVLPSQHTERNDFEHLATLTETIKTAELLTLPATEILWRLYHEEEVTVYDPQPVVFHCSCSLERCGEILKTLPQEDVDQILAEEGQIEMQCDYCHTNYTYHAADIAAIRNAVSNSNAQTAS